MGSNVSMGTETAQTTAVQRTKKKLFKAGGLKEGKGRD